MQRQLTHTPESFLLLRFTIVEPGPVTTVFAENAQVSEAGEKASKVDAVTGDGLLACLAKWKEVFPQIGQKPEEIADTILEVITTEDLKFRYITNKHMLPVLEKKYSDLTGNVGLNALKEMMVT